MYSGEKEQNATFIKMTEKGLENMVIFASTRENMPQNSVCNYNLAYLLLLFDTIALVCPLIQF